MTEYRWDDLYIGLKHGFDATLTSEDAVGFAALSGDINPLHTDAEYARSAGFAGPVLFGMLVSALYSRLVGVYLPGKYALLQGIDIDFNAPCYAGDRLRVEGQIIFLSDVYRRCEIRASIRRDGTKLISRAVIRTGLHVN